MSSRKIWNDSYEKRKNNPKYKQYHKEYYLKRIKSETWSENYYKKLYGISIEDYNKLFDLQKGCCAICGKHQVNFKRRLAVDHDHNTGKVRGLLCHSCNTHLGIYEKHKTSFDLYLKG